jgi:Na+-transporting methylmalonyl-CoA/oxaloacetate decarboxylase gamma subunit
MASLANFFKVLTIEKTPNQLPWTASVLNTYTGKDVTFQVTPKELDPNADGFFFWDKQGTPRIVDSNLYYVTYRYTEPFIEFIYSKETSVTPPPSHTFVLFPDADEHETMTNRFVHTRYAPHLPHSSGDENFPSSESALFFQIIDRLLREDGSRCIRILIAVYFDGSKEKPIDQLAANYSKILNSQRDATWHFVSVGIGCVVMADALRQCNRDTKHGATWMINPILSTASLLMKNVASLHPFVDSVKFVLNKRKIQDGLLTTCTREIVVCVVQDDARRHLSQVRPHAARDVYEGLLWCAQGMDSRVEPKPKIQYFGNSDTLWNEVLVQVLSEKGDKQELETNATDPRFDARILLVTGLVIVLTLFIFLVTVVVVAMDNTTPASSEEEETAAEKKNAPVNELTTNGSVLSAPALPTPNLQEAEGKPSKKKQTNKRAIYERSP